MFTPKTSTPDHVQTGESGKIHFKLNPEWNFHGFHQRDEENDAKHGAAACVGEKLPCWGKSQLSKSTWEWPCCVSPGSGILLWDAGNSPDPWAEDSALTQTRSLNQKWTL